MTNNIFDYATSELSQDAFLCWCVGVHIFRCVYMKMKNCTRKTPLKWMGIEHYMTLCLP